jgi:aspartate racemase
MEALVQRGAGGIVLGCTEIGMLVGQQDASVPVFDTTVIHSERAVEWALS